VHSGPEPSRHTIDLKVSLHDMEDTYLPAFRQAVISLRRGTYLDCGADTQAYGTALYKGLIAAGDHEVFVGGGQPGTGAAGIAVPLKIAGEQKLPRKTTRSVLHVNGRTAGSKTQGARNCVVSAHSDA
jgi:hypothetical protein